MGFNSGFKGLILWTQRQFSFTGQDPLLRPATWQQEGEKTNWISGD